MLNTSWYLHNKCVVRQYFAGFVVNLYIIGFGIFEGWSSPMNILLTSSDETPLPSGKISMEEVSWITSLLSLGAFVSSIVFAFANNFGRKLTLFMIGIPMIITWLFIWFAQNPVYLYISRFMGGFIGAAGYMIVPMFLSEISEDRIRGTLLASVYALENFGILLGYIIGNYFDYYAMPLFSIILISIYTILISYLPESAIFMVRQNKIDEAKKSICYYKNKDDTIQKDVLEIDVEIDKIKRALERDKRTPENNKWTPKTITIVLKATITGIVLAVLFIYSGVTPMIFYTANIFQETGSNLSPNMSAIVAASIQLFGTFAATELVERVGRKILLVVSCFGTALSLIVLGLYMMLKTWEIPVEVVNWVPLAAFSSALFISAIGIQALALSVIFEIAPERIKEMYTSFCMGFSWLLSFTSTKYLPLFFDVFGFHGSMYIFAGICVLSAIYIILYMPETKGKSYEEIMESLAGKTVNLCA